MGNVSKTVRVYSNDPSRPVATLSVRMYVKDAVHMKRYRPNEIFSAPCSGCHADRGRGKRGRALFISDCLMCHGEHMSAAPVQAMKGKKRAYLFNAVRNGVRGAAMPGWATGNGGPLSDEEVSSLVDYLSEPVKR